ncbi:unnamed protein product, partial [Ectocarpus sp. 8 AP-2014]
MTIRKIMHPPKGDLDGGGNIVGYGTDEWRQEDALIEDVYVPNLLDEQRYRIATGGYVEALRRSPGLAESCQYFTVFRHPVNRVVSAYYYCRNPRHSWDPLHASSVKLLRDNSKAVGVVEEFDSTMALLDRAGVIPGTRWAASTAGSASPIRTRRPTRSRTRPCGTPCCRRRSSSTSGWPSCCRSRRGGVPRLGAAARHCP